MEFNEKLQKLRKEKGLTQEELAKSLFVSRTAISKWELGKGYPNLTSLKDIAKFFGISIDELLSGEELLSVAEQESKKRINDIHTILFGLLDISLVLLLVLPLLAQRVDGQVLESSLLGLTGSSLYLKIAYFLLIFGMIVWGALTILLRNCQKELWIACRYRVSLLGSGAGVLLFTISLHPYAAVLLFVFLAVKVFSLIK